MSEGESFEDKEDEEHDENDDSSSDEKVWMPVKKKPVVTPRKSTRLASKGTLVHVL